MDNCYFCLMTASSNKTSAANQDILYKLVYFTTEIVSVWNMISETNHVLLKAVHLCDCFLLHPYLQYNTKQGHILQLPALKLPPRLPKSQGSSPWSVCPHSHTIHSQGSVTRKTTSPICNCSRESQGTGTSAVVSMHYIANFFTSSSTLCRV